MFTHLNLNMCRPVPTVTVSHRCTQHKNISIRLVSTFIRIFSLLRFISKASPFSSDQRSQTVWSLQWVFPDLDSKPIDCSTCLFEHKASVETLTQHLVKVDQLAGENTSRDSYSSTQILNFYSPCNNFMRSYTRNCARSINPHTL